MSLNVKLTTLGSDPITKFLKNVEAAVRGAALITADIKKAPSRELFRYAHDKHTLHGILMRTVQGTGRPESEARGLGTES